jgi:hypothetical protein
MSGSGSGAGSGIVPAMSGCGSEDPDPCKIKKYGSIWINSTDV